jgi:hypothetical protein
LSAWLQARAGVSERQRVPTSAVERRAKKDVVMLSEREQQVDPVVQESVVRNTKVCLGPPFPSRDGQTKRGPRLFFRCPG